MGRGKEGKKKMAQLININMGIDSMAKSFLTVHSKGVTFEMKRGKKHFPDSEVYSRVGEIPSVELRRYPLKDGTFAEEFVQAAMKIEDGRRLYFLGLRAHDKNMIWPSSKIRSKIIGEICSN